MLADARRDHSILLRTAQYILLQLLEYTRLKTSKTSGLLLSQDLKPEHEPFAFSLDLKLGFSLLSKVYLNQV